MSSTTPNLPHRHLATRRNVARLLETIDTIDLPQTNAPRRPRQGTALAYARSCYDHLAGELAVAIYDAMTAKGWIDTDGDHPQLTPTGTNRLTDLGLDVAHLRNGRRPLVRTCLDWTERRQHLAGASGAALLDHMLTERWVRRARDHRVLQLTETGRDSLCRHFDLTVAG